MLIQWTNSLPKDATWEQVDVIKAQFPEFHLQDKVDLWHAGNDRPPGVKVYTRRHKKGGNT